MNKQDLQRLSDEDIIHLIVEEKQNDVFEVLFKRYYQKVHDKCFSLLRNREQADEFAEDIFSKVFEKLQGFRRASSFSTWLYSVTYNHCIDYLRNKKKLHYPDWNRENEIPEIISESEEEISDINFTNLQVILELIHPEEKALLLMKYIDNLPGKQIAQSLRITEDAAKMRIKRAKARVLYLYKKKFLKDK